ncbi:MAG: hypothetical protein FWH41_01890 [Treponema sp.]|nr:hypothetical protein [Treponema sp.]
MKAMRLLGCLALMGILGSCVTGQYMSLGRNDNAEILGSVSADFTITGSFRYRKVINTQAYMNLLAEAQKAYPGNIDVRDISWAVGGGDSANNNYKYTAVGKVIRN